MTDIRKYRQIISLNIDLLSYSDALAKIILLARAKQPGYICFANVHMTIEAHKDEIFAKQVNAANIVTADGMPIVKTLKFFYGKQQERIAGMDAFPDLLKLATDNELNVFFFGTTPELLSKLTEKARRQFPGIKIVGAFSPPFNKSLNDPDYIEMINDSGAHLVFVALGCPKQEKWMSENSNKLNALLLGVGGAFPIYAETARRAPLFMRNMGMEWLYRLLQEPRRLFKRYLVTNTLYIFLVLKAKLYLMLHKHPA